MGADPAKMAGDVATQVLRVWAALGTGEAPRMALDLPQNAAHPIMLVPQHRASGFLQAGLPLVMASLVDLAQSLDAMVAACPWGLAAILDLRLVQPACLFMLLEWIREVRILAWHLAQPLEEAVLLTRLLSKPETPQPMHSQYNHENHSNLRRSLQAIAI